MIYRDRKDEIKDFSRDLYDFLDVLRYCVRPEVMLISEFDLASLYRPSWMVRELYRVGSYFMKFMDDPYTPAALHYVRGCCGHRVEREILKYPRLCALWAGTRIGGRWREAEDVIGGDHLAMWMYSSRVLRGRLPSHLHNRIMMESYMSRTIAGDLYLDWLAQNFGS